MESRSSDFPILASVFCSDWPLRSRKLLEQGRRPSSISPSQLQRDHFRFVSLCSHLWSSCHGTQLARLVDHVSGRTPFCWPVLMRTQCWSILNAACHSLLLPCLSTFKAPSSSVCVACFECDHAAVTPVLSTPVLSQTTVLGWSCQPERFCKIEQVKPETGNPPCPSGSTLKQKSATLKSETLHETGGQLV